MSRLQCRGPIATAAVLVALLSSSAVEAQVTNDPGPPREPGGLVNNMITGAQYDIWNQQKAERRLRHIQENGGTGHPAYDARKIPNLQQRIAVDEWLIRKSLRLDPGCYPNPPRLDAISCEAIALASRPEPYPMWLLPPPPTMTVPASVPITIVNAGPAGTSLAFAINNVPHQADGGSRQDLSVTPDSVVTYDAGGTLGRRRYTIIPGTYEFRSTPEGWALYKLP